VARVDAQDHQIMRAIGVHDLDHFELAMVGKNHGHLGGAAHDVKVGGDPAVLAHDEAGAEAVTGPHGDDRWRRARGDFGWASRRAPPRALGRGLLAGGCLCLHLAAMRGAARTHERPKQQPRPDVNAHGTSTVAWVMSAMRALPPPLSLCFPFPSFLSICPCGFSASVASAGGSPTNDCARGAVCVFVVITAALDMRVLALGGNDSGATKAARRAGSMTCCALSAKVGPRGSACRVS